ncbi:MAG: tetratricopeptide repeat protein [Selenomonadaceae bacterium]|nr:tetratricopeptide repeat protein [Selenomonadaceae bacterium]
MKLLKIFTALCCTFSFVCATHAQTDKVSYDNKTEFIERDSSFSEKSPVFTDKIKRALEDAKWIIGNFREDMTTASKTSPQSVKIMGEAVATETQMLDFLLKHNKTPKLTCSPEELIHYYYVEAAAEGIRPDLALCQSFKETGFYNYGGDVRPSQNNYCGLGATGGGKHGAAFPTPQIGARAHIQHIKVYASKEPPKTEIVDPRYALVKQARPDIFGNIKTWIGLNGRWAVPGTYYGQDIIKKLNYALSPSGLSEEIENANLLLRIAPNDYTVYIYRGIAYFKNGNTDKALNDFSKSISIKETWEAYYNLGVLYTKTENFAKAIDAYNNAAKISSAQEELYYNRGLLYFSLGEYEKAEADFKKTLSINPHVAEIATYKAICEIKLKKYEEAWADFYKASQINTVNPIVKENRAVLEKCVNF